MSDLITKEITIDGLEKSEDTKKDGTFVSVFCDPRSLDQVRKAINPADMNIESGEIEWVAQQQTDLSDEQSDKAVQFLSAIEDLDDVQNVYTTLA